MICVDLISNYLIQHIYYIPNHFQGGYLPLLTITNNYNIDNVLQGCQLCGYRVMNYTPEFIQLLKKEFSELKEFKIFWNKYNENPDLVNDLCERCQISYWQKLKYTNHSEYIILLFIILK